MGAFYVDLANGTGWSQPCDLDPQSCADEVIDAMNDYQVARQRIDAPVLFYDDKDLQQGLDALDESIECPTLPHVSITASLVSTTN
jgi:hypothetical protein